MLFECSTVRGQPHDVFSLSPSALRCCWLLDFWVWSVLFVILIWKKTGVRGFFEGTAANKVQDVCWYGQTHHQYTPSAAAAAPPPTTTKTTGGQAEALQGQSAADGDGILREAWPVGEGAQPSGDGGRPHIEIGTSAAGQVASSFVVCDSGCKPCRRWAGQRRRGSPDGRGAGARLVSCAAAFLCSHVDTTPAERRQKPPPHTHHHPLPGLQASSARHSGHSVRQSTRLLEEFWCCPDNADNREGSALFLDMAVDKCRMVETVQILWSLRSWCCPPLSLLTAVSAAVVVSQRPWTTSNSGDGDLAASSFSVVCPGECGARFRALKCSGYFSANVV